MPKRLLDIWKDGKYPKTTHDSRAGVTYTLDYDWTGSNDVSGPGAIPEKGYGAVISTAASKTTSTVITQGSKPTPPASKGW